MPSDQIKAEARIVGGLINNNKDTSGGVTKRVRTSEGYYCEISMHDTV
jgi:hypothetical protein